MKRELLLYESSSLQEQADLGWCEHRQPFTMHSIDFLKQFDDGVSGFEQIVNLFFEA